MDELMKDDSLITAASVTPDPDQGCVTTCYYVGWEWDHSHGGGCATDAEQKSNAAAIIPC